MRSQLPPLTDYATVPECGKLNKIAQNRTARLTMTSKEEFSSEQIEHLWTYRNHVDQEFFTRLNFFLVFESILIGATINLVTKTSAPTLVIRIIEIAGLVITAVFWYAQVRSKYVLDKLAELCDIHIPEYRQFRARNRWPISSMKLLAWGIPPVIAIIWICTLFI